MSYGLIVNRIRSMQSLACTLSRELPESHKIRPSHACKNTLVKHYFLISTQMGFLQGSPCVVSLVTFHGDCAMCHE